MSGDIKRALARLTHIAEEADARTRGAVIRQIATIEAKWAQMTDEVQLARDKIERLDGQLRVETSVRASTCVVLDAVTAELDDQDRPEESPVDAVRRLRAEVERLTEDETERVQDARHAMRLARIDRGVAQAEVERLTRERDAETSERRRWERLESEARKREIDAGNECAAANLRAETAERERDEARRQLCAVQADVVVATGVAVVIIPRPAGLGWTQGDGAYVPGRLASPEGRARVLWGDDVARRLYPEDTTPG